MKHSRPVQVGLILVSLILGLLPSVAQLGLPVISMSPARKAEGQAGQSTLQVPLFLSAPATGPVAVNWTVNGGTAELGTDFSPGGGTVTFQPGEIRQTIQLTIQGDTLDEYDETIALLLSNPVGAVIGNDLVEARIANDERRTVVVFAPGTGVLEKNHPADALPFVYVNQPLPGRTVASDIVGGTATPGVDFIGGPGVLDLSAAKAYPDFAPLDDALIEPDETFSVLLSKPGPCVFIQPRIPSQILPAVPTPGSVAVAGDVMATGGADGLRIFSRKAGVWSQDSFIAGAAGGVFSVAVDRAVVAADFAESGVRIFVRSGDGIWTQEALIPRIAAAPDSRRVLAMQDEVLLIGDPAEAGQNSVSGEVRVHERHSGGPSAWGLATVLQPAAVMPDFGIALAISGNAMAIGAPGGFSVSVYERNPANQQVNLVKEHIYIIAGFGRFFALNDNTLVMSIPASLLTSRRSETSPVTWSNPVQQIYSPLFAVQQLALQDGVLWTYHANTGLRSLVAGATNFWTDIGQLSLAQSSAAPARRFAWSDRDLVITGVETDGSMPLLVHRDSSLNSTIVDDEGIVFTIGDSSSSGGFGFIPVMLSRALPVEVTVECVSVQGTATSGDDYVPFTTTVTVGAGDTSASIAYTVTAPEAGEPVEQFQIALQNPSVGTAGPAGTITIRPPYPAITADKFSYDFQEGNSGTGSVTVLFNLSSPAGPGASFDWALNNGTAIAGSDFPAASGTVNVTEGATTTSFTCLFNGDTTPEATENFYARITDTRFLSPGSSLGSYINLINDDTGILVADFYSTPQNTPLSGQNVRSNDTNVDMIQVLSSTQNGVMAVTTTGALVYTPKPNFIGQDSFTYKNIFSILNSPDPAANPTATVTITVIDGLIPPLLKPDSFTTREETLLDTATLFNGGLLENDELFNSSGVAYNPIIEKQILNVTNGTVSNFAGNNGTFRFMPALDFSGVATFSYRVRDKDGWSLPALVRITVTDDFPLPALQRLNPPGSQLFRSYLSNAGETTTDVLDWSVNLKAGQTISMRSNSTGTLGVLAIRDSSGASLTGGIGGPNSLEYVPIPADGTYVVAAGQRSGGSSGAFLFVVNGGAAPPTATAAAPYNLDAAQLPGSLRAAVAAVALNTVTPSYYSFTGSAGETIRVYLHSTLAQSFSIQNTAGAVLATSTVSPFQTTASTLQYTLPEAGSYRIVVAGMRLAEYSLELMRPGRNLEYSTAALPLLEAGGFGYLTGRGISGRMATGPVSTFAAFADYGANTIEERDVSIMVKSWNPDFLITAGDHNYNGDYRVGASSWTTNVGNYYGSFMQRRLDNRYPEQSSLFQRFFPAPGNHDSGPDFNNGGELSGYFEYFYSNPGGLPRLPAGVHQPMLSYYKMSQGNMDFFFLDSDNAAVNPSVRTLQRQWLKDQLAVSTAKWKFAVWHHPPFSSGNVHGSQAFMQWGQDFAGLTAILTGHEHIYERLDAGFGVTQFIVGLGGASPYGLNTTPVSNSLFRYNARHGALRVTTGTEGVRFEFFSIGPAGGALIDSYSIGTIEGGPVAGGVDTWSMRVQPGEVFRLTTRTPASPGSFTNDLNPALRIFNQAGVLVASDNNSAPDGRNASVLVTIPTVPAAPPEGLLWTVKVANDSNGSGEYEILRSTPDTSAYDAWAALQLPDPGARETSADPDLDGAPNLMEFLLGSNPTVKNSGPPLVPVPSSSPGVIMFFMPLPANWAVPVSVLLQSSDTMVPGSWITEAVKNPNRPWTSDGPVVPQPAAGGFTFAVDGAQGRKFYRLWLGLN